jgi:pimeloyl-ACP methyl ester carboxylesterase
MTQYPQVVIKSLILVGTPAVRLPLSGRAKRRIALVKTVKRLSGRLPRTAQGAVTKWLSRFGSDDYRNAGEMRDILVRAVNEDLRDVLASVRVPTLLLWGRNDQAAPLEIGRIMESSIAGSGLVVFAESGHFPYLDEPQAFAAVTTSFLDSMARRGKQ